LRTQKIVVSLFILLAIFSFTGQNADAQKAQIDILSPFNQAEVKPNPTTLIKPETQQTSGTPVKTSDTEKHEVKEAKIKKDDINPLLNPANSLGLAAAETAINKTYLLIKQNKLNEARLAIEPTVEWLTSATEYHTNLYKALKDINDARSQAELEKELALQFAICRDQAMYQLALLYIEDKKQQKAVEKLVNIVRSQPRTQLGFNAYQTLQQIGFTYKLQLPPTEESENTESNNEKTN